jgi:hypothetical protein
VALHRHLQISYRSPQIGNDLQGETRAPHFFLGVLYVRVKVKPLLIVGVVILYDFSLSFCRIVFALMVISDTVS